MDDDAFRGRLLPGERTVWSGRPGQGVIFFGRDLLLVPFSLLWCAFAIFWTATATAGVMASGRAAFAFLPLFGLAFVCVGLYFVFGRFLVDAWIRRGVRYALTDHRALILRIGLLASFVALRLDGLPQAQLSERAKGRGTIRFGQAISLSSWSGTGFSLWTPALDPTPQFLAIDDARRVFDLVQRAAAGGGT